MGLMRRVPSLPLTVAWQAKRLLSGAAKRSRSSRSSVPGDASNSAPSSTSTWQVPQLAERQEKGIGASITLHADSIPLRKILDAIEEQSGLSFSYSSRLFDDQQKVKIHVEGSALKPVLDFLFAQQDIRYEVIERQIVLKRARRLKPCSG